DGARRGPGRCRRPTDACMHGRHSEEDEAKNHCSNTEAYPFPTSGKGATHRSLLLGLIDRPGHSYEQKESGALHGCICRAPNNVCGTDESSSEMRTCQEELTPASSFLLKRCLLLL